MKSVLISIRPEWVEKILSGEKTVEVRKTAPKISTPFKCYIYCTRGNLSYKISGGMICHNNGGMGVVGEFVCDKIERIEIRHFTVLGHENRYAAVGDNPDHQWLKHSCLEYNEVARYGKCAPLYGWHISNLKIYDKPKDFREFFSPCEKTKYPYCFDCEHGLQAGEERPLPGMRYYDVSCGNWLKRPPQSWCYVEGASE